MWIWHLRVPLSVNWSKERKLSDMLQFVKVNVFKFQAILSTGLEWPLWFVFVWTLSTSVFFDITPKFLVVHGCFLLLLLLHVITGNNLVSLLDQVWLKRGDWLRYCTCLRSSFQINKCVVCQRSQRPPPP